METKVCCGCGLEKTLDEFYQDKRHAYGRGALCRKCVKKYNVDYYKKNRTRVLAHSAEQRRLNGSAINARQKEVLYLKGKCMPMDKNRECPVFLGVYVAETVLSGFFGHVKRMPYANPGYDFICGKGFKIDVKSSCYRVRAQRRNSWKFGIDQNAVADYFLCIGFDDRKSLNPLHVWLIPGNLINKKQSISIVDSESSLLKWKEFERPIDRVVSCCDKMHK